MLCLASRALLPVRGLQAHLRSFSTGLAYRESGKGCSQEAWESGLPGGVRAGSSVSEVREAFVTTPATMYGNPDELSTLIRLPYLIIRSELRQN